MKKTLFIVLLMCAFGAIKAQNEEYVSPEDDPDEIQTLFKGDISHGGYGSFSVKYNQIDNKDALLIGGRGAWIINHSIAIGIGGYGFFNEAAPPPDYTSLLGEKYRIGGGYGGLLIEPIIGSKYPVHIALPVLIGAGGIAYIEDYGDTWDNSTMSPNSSIDDDAFFVVEPGIEVELNLLKYLRLNFGAYYRYTTDITLEDLSKSPQLITDRDVLNGLSYGVTLKLGIF